MNWKTIIKEDAISKKNRDRRERASSIAGKGKSPVKLVGASDDKDKFGRIRDNDEEDSFADNDEYEEEFLADMTRYDLMNKVREMISGMTKEDLIELLINSQGDINLDISYDVNNSPLKPINHQGV